jgi:predicted dehydrogenase
VDVGIACLRAGVTALVEKPIADDPAAAARLCEEAQRTGTPLLVGHHRRHNVALQRARELVRGGAIGRPVTATVMATWLKPDAYFDLAWRRSAGGGPVLINLIHDIDMLRFLFGEVRSVQAMRSNVVRGFEVEDTAAALLRMDNGMLVSMAVTDAAVSPWNWDLGAGEAAHFPQQPDDSHYVSGTEGALTLPHLRLWQYRGARGWHEPLSREETPPHRCDPYERQLQHLRDVAERKEEPICSGSDGLRTLQATLAVLQAARTEQAVQPSEQPAQRAILGEVLQ